MFRSAFAGLALFTFLFAAAAHAQGTPGTPATPAKQAEPAKAAPVTPPAEPKAAVEPKAAAEPKPAVSKPGGTARTIVGEVVDPACYLVNGAHGDSHKECATACAKAGQTLAILEKKTNKLYLLVTDHPGDDPNKSVMDYIAQTVTVKGKAYSRGGVTGFMVVSVEPGAPKAN
jgi:hypothetical protein